MAALSEGSLGISTEQGPAAAHTAGWDGPGADLYQHQCHGEEEGGFDIMFVGFPSALTIQCVGGGNQKEGGINKSLPRITVNF